MPTIEARKISADPTSENQNTNRIRVVRVIDRLNVGGPAKHVAWLTAGLDQAEFETTLITGTVPENEGDMGYFAESLGVTPVVIREMSRELGARDVVVIAKLLALFFRLRPQIIHTHKAKAGAAGRIAAFLYKWLTPSALWLRPRELRVVHTFHGHVFHSYYGQMKTAIFVAIERILARVCTDQILVVSEQQRLEICRDFRIGKPEQFRVVPLGLDLDELQADRERIRREFHLTKKEVAVAIVGRLCEVKNHAMFVEAAARTAEQAVNSDAAARFIVVGDGHLRGEMEQLADRSGVSDSFVFTGFRDDAASLYGGFDIIALTSLNEGTPLTLIEAMGCGRAVVATEVGGVVDLMGAHEKTHDGFTVWEHGITSASRDIPAFARALRYLIEHPDLRAQMGDRGRMFVRSRYSRNRLIGDVQEIYRHLLFHNDGIASRTSRNMVSLSGKGNSL